MIYSRHKALFLALYASPAFSKIHEKVVACLVQEKLASVRLKAGVRPLLYQKPL